MDPRIIEKEERPRGCGHRKVGGLYFVGPRKGVACGLLPMPLRDCPTCGGGIKQARGFTWVDGSALVRHGATQCSTPIACSTCPMKALQQSPGKRTGLIWIGRRYYPTPEKFLNEAMHMGVSRRVPRVPKGFKVGEDTILLAHALTIPCGPCGSTGSTGIVDCERCAGNGKTPGAFLLFRPDAIEVVVKKDATEEEIDALIKRGLTPVVVKRLDESGTPTFNEEFGHEDK